MLNFDRDFKNFNPKTAYIQAEIYNENILKKLGIDRESEDTVFGAKFVYCGAHVNPHSTGWCTVAIAQKRPLNASNIQDALIEVKTLGFSIL